MGKKKGKRSKLKKVVEGRKKKDSK